MGGAAASSVFRWLRRFPASVFAVGASYVLESCDKVIQNFSRYHNAVSVRAYFFGDAYHTASRIAFEVDEERFAIRYNFFRTNDIVVHSIVTGLVI